MEHVIVLERFGVRSFLTDSPIVMWHTNVQIARLFDSQGEASLFCNLFETMFPSIMEHGRLYYMERSHKELELQ